MKTSSKKLRGLIDQFAPVLTELKGYADLLDQKEALEEHLADLEKERRSQDAGLATYKTSVDQEAQAVTAAHQKTLAGHGAAVKQLEDRIEDLGRQRVSLEARLEEIRAAIADAKTTWEDQKQRDYQAHDQEMRRLGVDITTKQNELTGLQDRLRQVHASVGGLISGA